MTCTPNILAICSRHPQAGGLRLPDYLTAQEAADIRYLLTHHVLRFTFH